MDNKIQEITDKLYKEGVEKGNSEAQRIIDDAMAKQDAILKEANEKAERILGDAAKKSEELMRNTKSELKLYFQQAMEAFKFELVDVVSGNIVGYNVKAALEDKDFLKKMILDIAIQWAKTGDMVLQADSSLNLRDYFENNAKHLLDKGVTIKEINNKAVAFTVSPKDGSYKVQFGEQEFIKYFADFLRPQLFEMLFK